MIISVAAGVVATVFGWFAKGYLKRMDRDRAESNARMDRERAESNARMDSLKADLTKNLDSFKADLTKNLDSFKEEMTKNVNSFKEEMTKNVNSFKEEMTTKMDSLKEEMTTKMDSLKEDLTKKMESDKAELIERIRESDARNEEAHRETRAVLYDLNVRVGRLEGARDAKDSSTGGAEQHSPRRNDDPSAAPAGEAEPAQAAEPLDRSMVPMAGIGAEPDHAAGLAHQAVPGQKSAEESGAEPNAEESPDTAR